MTGPADHNQAIHALIAILETQNTSDEEHGAPAPRPDDIDERRATTSIHANASY